MAQATAPRRHGVPFSLLTAEDRAALPADAVDAHPLSTLQSGVLFEAVSAGRPGLYHDVLTYRLTGPLDVSAFTRAVRELAERHPIFRTSFHLEGFSEPVQIVHARVSVPLRVTDLSGLPAGEVGRRLAADAERELAAGFDYGTCDLVRVRVHLLPGDEYQYTLSYHDAAIDSTSVRIVHHDLFDAYFRLTSGAGEPGPDGSDGSDGHSYRDFVAAEREALDSPGPAEFWRATLDGAEGTRIPPYGDVPPDTPEGLGVREVELPAGLAGAVTDAAERLSVPVPTVLAAAHVKVLSLLSGRTDVLTGYEHSGRPEAAGAQRLAGLFLNTLPLRVRCRPGTWRDLVGAVRDAERAWQPHRQFPMPEIKRRLGIRGPLVETVFNVTPVHALGELARRYGFVLPRADLNARTEFPFRAEFGHDHDTGELRFAIHHHSDRFGPDQIGRVAGYYLAALRAIGADPDARHDRAELMDPAETALVTGGFCGRDRILPAGTFADQFDRVAATWPDRTALVHGDQRLDYAALRAAAEEAADRLHAHGLRPGDACAVALPRGVPWAVTMLALLLRGGVYVPVDPTHPPARIAAAADRAGAVLLVTDAAGAAAISPALAERAVRCRVVAHDADAPTGRASADRGPAGPEPGDDAYILFTSGTTGEPKGARITHAGMLNHLLAKVDELGLVPDDRIAQTAS
ncbi:MAG TPA: condensation domain-containing protein, partial [Mycobacteriales bacterium]|nr:condensation domain-containing protein [Mycobacteriales bacterium]